MLLAYQEETIAIFTVEIEEATLTIILEIELQFKNMLEVKVADLDAWLVLQITEYNNVILVKLDGQKRDLDHWLLVQIADIEATINITIETRRTELNLHLITTITGIEDDIGRQIDDARKYWL